MSGAHRAGWIMFLVSALLFGWSGVQTGDWWVVVGSAVFGSACVLFLLPDGDPEA
ncbi:MAG TPA: hypothetical protein VK866_14990 [Acidimicrobiales bacterium]|nr:hypothetical protein [Acidimicrobiales bacterium]